MRVSPGLPGAVSAAPHVVLFVVLVGGRTALSDDHALVAPVGRDAAVLGVIGGPERMAAVLAAWDATTSCSEDN